MSDFAQRRKELRPHGMVAVSCPPCVFFDRCGGIESEHPLLNCFDLHCCGNGKCDNVCPHKPDFMNWLLEVGGLEFDGLPSIAQVHVQVPQFVPMIHHRYRRHLALEWPTAALDTYQVMRLKGRRYEAVATDADNLRQSFGLHPSTLIILRGTAKDRCLERYWAFRRSDKAPEQLARLGVSLVIGPNFSHFLDVPRTDNLFNRKRQLICLDELFRAGLSPVPHLSAQCADQRADWRFWHNYLRDNTTVQFVAVEFQTGNRNSVEGQKVIDRVAELRDALGRPIHLLAIGGAQFVEYLSVRLGTFSLIDSTPFMKAVKRQIFDPTKTPRPWKKVRTAKGQPIDSLTTHNLTQYAGWIERRCRAGDAAAQVGAGGSHSSARIPLQTC
jgi:Domain of unknown function (DUF4417)